MTIFALQTGIRVVSNDVNHGLVRFASPRGISARACKEHSPETIDRAGAREIFQINQIIIVLRKNPEGLMRMARIKLIGISNNGTTTKQL